MMKLTAHYNATKQGSKVLAMCMAIEPLMEMRNNLMYENYDPFSLNDPVVRAENTGINYSIKPLCVGENSKHTPVIENDLTISRHGKRGTDY